MKPAQKLNKARCTSSLVKAFWSDAVVEVTYDATQLNSAIGISKECLLKRYYRDERILTRFGEFPRFQVCSPTLACANSVSILFSILPDAARGIDSTNSICFGTL
ncbi:MAG: hypothetical protein KAI09_00320 [Dehalococcoidales bacterium]|nr:hypothetical protein [Dehalococcoidales bacterium]